MIEDEEIWRPVPSKPEIMASSHGRVLFPPRMVRMPNGGERKYETKPTIWSVRRAKKGAKHCYRGLWMRHYGNIKVHQLICEAFHGPKPSPKHEVMHRDEDGLNNRADNLLWGTRKENLNAPGFLEYCRSDERKAALRKRAA